MSTRISKPIVVAELTTFDGQRIVFPLAFPESTWFANRGEDMLQHLRAALQKDVLNHGMLLDTVRMAVPQEFFESIVDVPTPAGNHVVPALERFHVFTADLGEGRCHSFVPALGIEVVSAGADAVAKDVCEHVRLEHMRSERFADLRRLIACQWYKEVRLRHFSIELDVLGPDEQLKKQVARILPDVANYMGNAPPAAGLETALEELTRRVEGKFSRSVLVVGPESSGKTSLIHAYAQQRRKRDLPQIWETSSVRLLQALTKDGGWQQALSVLCNELYDEEIVLYVGHLNELFEVGQYSGNNVSIGAALREQLQRGRILLLAEATEAEVAKLELINTGYCALFQELRMPHWNDDEQQQVVAEAIAGRSHEHGVAVADEAVEEAILLQRRYSPYSGFPGKPIRFLEALILQQKLRGLPLQREHAMRAFCAETGIPQNLLDAALELDTAAMRTFFQKRIFGQHAAIDLVCDTLLSIKATMTRAGKPIASLLFIGPTGVGKTETAKALAEYMFGDPERMLRFDMSEYADPVAVLRLTGDLGNDEGTLVTRIRQQPFSVVLFDEVEKAHHSFFDLLLQILGEGRLTGGKGQLANFCSAVIIMTSNIGATEMQRQPMGMVPGASRGTAMVRHFEHAVQNHFRPELFNRLDHIVPFAPLDDKERYPIIERELGMVRARQGMRQRAVSLHTDEGVVAHLCAGVQDDRYGARQMQRVLQDQLVLPLARLLSVVPSNRPIAVVIKPEAGGLAVTHTPGSMAPRPSLPDEADHAAQLRRQLQKIQAGPVWTELTNKRYMLRLQRERMAEEEQEARFWQLHGEQYNAIKAVLQDGDALLGEILQGEGGLLAAQMDERNLAGPAFDCRSWEERYLDCKARTLGLTRPEANLCTIGIYGPVQAIEPLRNLYIDIMQQAGFAMRAQAVHIDLDNHAKQEWPVSGDTRPLDFPLAGYELECKGAGAYYLFSGENGMWRASEDDKRSTDLYVYVSSKKLDAHATPSGVHRRSFYEGLQAVRSIKRDHISDVKSDWRCDYPHAGALLEQMKRRWSRLADAILTGEETA